MLKLITTNKTINLVLKTRKLVDISNVLKGKNFEDVFFKAINEVNIDALAKIIYLLAESEEGKDAFKNSTEVYDFIDDYKAENKKTYNDIFKEIAEVVNNEGFFNTQMSQEQLEEKISNPFLQMDINETMKNSVQKALISVAEKEIISQV